MEISIRSDLSVLASFWFLFVSVSTSAAEMNQARQNWFVGTCTDTLITGWGQRPGYAKRIPLKVERIRTTPEAAMSDAEHVLDHYFRVNRAVGRTNVPSEGRRLCRADRYVLPPGHTLFGCWANALELEHSPTTFGKMIIPMRDDGRDYIEDYARDFDGVRDAHIGYFTQYGYDTHINAGLSLFQEAMNKCHLKDFGLPPTRRSLGCHTGSISCANAIRTNYYRWW